MTGSDDEFVLFDTNLLVYARDLDSPYYQRSKELQDLVNSGELKAAITPQNLLEFYSVTTNLIKNKNADSQKEAIDEIEKYLISPFELVVPSGSEIGIVLRLIKDKKLRGRKIFDVYLAATMLSNGIDTIYTANVKDFKMFSEIKAVNPFK